MIKRTFETELVYTYEDVMSSVTEYNLASSMIAGYVSLQCGPSISVLEVGSGSGLLTRELLQLDNVSQIVCVDPDCGACEYNLNRNKDSRLKVIDASYFDVDFGSNVFDVSVSRFALHHIPDQHKASFISLQRKQLKPNGLMLIGDMVIPSYSSETERVKSIRRYYEKTIRYAQRLGHVGLISDQYECLEKDIRRDDEYKISQEMIVSLIKQCGFSDISVSLVPGAWPGLVVIAARVGGSK